MTPSSENGREVLPDGALLEVGSIFLEFNVDTNGVQAHANEFSVDYTYRLFEKINSDTVLGSINQIPPG